MTHEEHKERMNENNVKQFACKWIVEHKVYDTDEIFVDECLDITDERMEACFKNCVLPLNKNLYSRCRKEIIKRLKEDYGITG